MPKCTFCNKMYKRPKGTTVVNSASGEIYHFCSSKCRKYAEMKRKKKKWTVHKEIVMEDEEEEAPVIKDEPAPTGVPENGKKKEKTKEEPKKEGKEKKEEKK